MQPKSEKKRLKSTKKDALKSPNTPEIYKKRCTKKFQNKNEKPLPLFFYSIRTVVGRIDARNFSPSLNGFIKIGRLSYFFEVRFSVFFFQLS